VKINIPEIKWIDITMGLGKFKTQGYVGRQRFITIFWDATLPAGSVNRYKINSWLPGLKVKQKKKHFETREEAIEMATKLFNEWFINLYI